ncbi:MAG TPA: glycosyltransferase [Geminicoccus sp.]|jgi:glycosyltransferase Alg8|uniref:glycosyltransferase n=1 Tax=Geminicoccus sp. TaxID=2024832 RepID=UPI002E310AE6|nr:glycosyltransferase [Geminicoccus sp.]HEX2526987.1 glycosyltransferase [Geminicoccus sp.]
MILALHFLVVAAAVILVPPSAVAAVGHGILFVPVTVGIWRYGWGLVHLVRALLFRGLVFPRLRRRAERAWEPGIGAATELFVIVTSYRIAAATTLACWRSVIAEAAAWEGPVTLVASVVERGDEMAIRRLFDLSAPPSRVRLLLVRLPGQGKRRALATALRGVSRRMPPPDAVVAVMDGDTILPVGSLARTVPFFLHNPRLGGITTDERPATLGHRFPFSSWYQLRFARRHQTMSSVALSGRVLAMTGRFSLFPADIATDPSFIDTVENDGMDHWRLGHIPFLTGEDKSTWFHLLRAGRPMLYVPDVQVLTVEHPPPGGFLRASRKLVLRWSGNMLRSGRKAIALGPGRTGWFLWWSLIDQRISIWTPLIGPIAAIVTAVVATPWALLFYAIWVVFTRSVQTLVLLTARSSVEGSWPLLLWYDQVVLALVKARALFRLDRQRWTRQNISSRSPANGWRGALVEAGAIYLQVLAVLGLGTFFVFWSGTFPWPFEGH